MPRKYDLAELADFAGRLADAAGQAILPHFRSNAAIENKSPGAGFDPVTEADKAAERAVRTLIEQAYPDHGIQGEELDSHKGKSALTWTIDPIDGTRTFVMGGLHWGTLIALYENDTPLVGVLDQPYSSERWLAVPGLELARFVRGKDVRQLKSRKVSELAEAVLSTTHPALFEREQDRQAFDKLSARTRLTLYGGDCYAYGLIALGCHDLVVETGLKPYDIRALVPIVEAAGGVIATWDGKPAAAGGRIVAAATQALLAAALEVLNGD